MSKVFAKFGRDLAYETRDEKGEIKRISLFTPEDFKKKSIIRESHAKSDPFKDIGRLWNAKFTSSNLFKSCVICGETKGVEMHHVRKIRELKKKDSKMDFYTRQMAAINRKQVPLCKKHHIGLHNDT